MSDSLDPDQARRFVGPDLRPTCLPRLSADDTGRQTVKSGSIASWSLFDLSAESASGAFPVTLERLTHCIQGNFSSANFFQN